MSKAKISETTKKEMILVSGGRCEICNDYMFQDGFTKKRTNFSEHAHIIADSNKGPRANPNKKYRENPENLMLLCSNCHTKIDKNPEDYPEDLLRKFKSEHEFRIKYITGIKYEKVTEYSIFNTVIGMKDTFADNKSMISSILNDGYYPRSDFPLDLSSNSSSIDDSSDFYKEHINDLSAKYHKYEKEIKSKTCFLFAIAPQPLLIKLGTLLLKDSNIIVKQRSRATQSWDWQDSSSRQRIIIKKPDSPSKDKKPILLIDISDKVVDLKSSFPFLEEFDFWEITVKNPNMNFIKSHEEVNDFSEKSMNLLSEISQTYGNNSSLIVVPIMPNSLAVEFGRVWMPKAHCQLDIYDRKMSSRKFEFCLTIK